MPALNFFGNNVNASGPMLWVVCNALSGSGGMTIDELSSHLQPSPYINATPKRRETSGASAPWTALSQSLSVGVAVGLLTSQGRRTDATFSLSIPDETVSDPDAFRRAVRRAILAGTKEDDGSVVYGDLPLALAWLMGSRVEESFWVSYANGPEQRLRVRGAGPVKNASQWSPFYRWAEFLGLATVSRHTRINKLGNPVVADPRTAIRDELTEFPKKLSGVEFAKRLAEALPVVSEGAVSESFTSGGGTFEADMSDGTRFSPVVSHALLTLAESGHIALKRKDDASNRITLAGPAGPVIVDEVTHD